MTPPLTPPQDLRALVAFSAKIGCDPALIQAAGGNTSVKSGDVMWIKASGTRLAEAKARDIFTPVNLPAICAALDNPGVDADRPEQFALGDAPLRPSIETILHAVFPQRVVIHVHCVNTLAHVVRADADALLADRMAGFDWCLVPYARPGTPLARQVRDRRGAKTSVVVLANHGLIIAADTVTCADALLGRVVEALRCTPAPRHTPDLAALSALAGAGWDVPPADAAIHQLAVSHGRLKQATAGSLYPDHVIFCGIAATACHTAPDAADAPPFVLIPGKGALIQQHATTSAKAMAHCLGEVLMRVPEEARLHYLTFAQNAELLNWDAEKYRQRLNA